MKIILEEYEPVLINTSKILGIIYDQTNALESLKKIKESLYDISADKKQPIGMELYQWLICHKPKFLRDGIMVELNSVGARYMDLHLKNIVLLWIDIQTLLIENNGVPTLSEVVDEDNQPKKVFDD